MRNYFLLFFCMTGLSLFSYENGWQEMSDLLPENPLIFDIGANVGQKTERYLKLSPSAVISVETLPACVEQLNKQYENVPNVFVEPYCVSDSIGEIEFFISDAYSYLSTADEDWKHGRFKDFSWTRSFLVPTITLDSLIDKYGMPDFCKIDVEGFELNVLKGMTKPIPYLSFEFASEYLEKKTKPCLDYLSSLGYKSFNVAILSTEAFNGTGKWVSADKLYDYLIHHPDPLNWGDVYARYD